MDTTATYVDVLLPLPADGAFTYSVPDTMKINAGMRVRVSFGSRTLTGAVIHRHTKKPEGFPVKPVSTVIDTDPLFDTRLISLTQKIAHIYICSHGEAIHCALPGGANGKSHYQKRFTHTVREFELNVSQQKICDAIRTDTRQIHLLHGITGSGKTEIYMQLARETIMEGRSVIFLVPEITLSSQLYRRLDSVFGDTLVVYHSGLTANQKADHWKRFYSGEARIVIGTRSAVFLQSPDTGLIIIDEEHDASYKEHKNPRYNTRRIALMRSREEQSTVVLGSATPSIESYHAAQNGQISLHTINERFNNAQLPTIETVCIDDQHSALTNRLRSETVSAVKTGGQAVLMLNRRGFAPIRMCGTCKKRMECPDCNISLTYHRDGFLKCHYCGYLQPDITECPACHSTDLLTVGAGTQRIEDEIEQLFPAFSVFRLDRDSARKKDTVDAMITGIDDGSIDIVIGTQMIAKGFDFHGITLVGVLMADIGMSLPDFRAGERTFSLLMQVAGRCGRGEQRGRVLIQTLDPENSIFTFLKNHDYESFFHQESAMRRMMQYPPFGRIIRFIIRGKDETAVAASAEKTGNYLQEVLRGEDVQLLGPAPAPFAKVAAQYRHHIILKCSVHHSLHGHLKKVKQTFSHKGVHVEVDVDPVDML